MKNFRNAWETLPEKFCLKSTLQSDGNYIKVITKSNTNLDQLCEELKDWFKVKNLLIHSYCKAYHKAIPRVLAEEYIESVKDQLYDYKFYCFNGVPYCVCASKEHFQDKFYPITYYDLQWNMLEVQSGKHRVEPIPMPEHLKEMIELAQKLSKGFPFLRVDFFDTKDKLYLAELTFYPGGGYFAYKPTSFNDTMGAMFNLSKLHC